MKTAGVTRETTASAASASNAGEGELGPSDVRDTLRRGELVFPPGEADTLTAHGVTTHGVASLVELDEDDLVTDCGIEASAADEEEQTVTRSQPAVAARAPASAADGDDPHSSPTIALAERSSAAREVYRLFLASEYAPALHLASDLIAQGDDDPMLATIARECRASMERSPFASAAFDGQTTLAEVAQRTGLSVEQIIGVLERSVVTGLISLRPPPA